MKSLSPRVMLSNHLLPKGSKMKVNLEDQSRQKVSFSFTQTKKSRQSLCFIPASPDKSVTEPQTKEDKGGHGKCNTELKQPCTVPESIAETHSQAPVTSATKSKPDVTMIHFKKQLISVSAAEEQPISVTDIGAIGVAEELPSEFQDPQMSSDKNSAEFSAPQPISVNSSESSPFEGSEARITPTIKTSAASSGKDGETSSSAECVNNTYKVKTRSQLDSTPICSESEGDCAQMSSSQKAPDSKAKSILDSRIKEVKKFSSGPHGEEKDKTSSKRSENHERSSSYSKLDRDSRHMSSRSSRSDKDRRRSRSRSRSRSRGSRTSSSHSRSERSRGDRGSRSERSYYHESDWRSHRSSPRRERRRSRSRTDRTRDSSDSEDDHRKTKTRTSVATRSSVYSSSHKESKSLSYSKSEKVSKSVGSPHSSEMDKKTQLTKTERTSKRSDSDLQPKCSPDLDSSHHRSSTHHRSETNRKSSSSSSHTRSQSYEKRHKSSSSESEADQKGKSQTSDKSPEDNNNKSVTKSGQPDLKQISTSVKNTEENRQSDHIFPSQASACTSTAELCQSEKEESPPHQDNEEQNTQYVKQMVPFVENTLEEILSKGTNENNSSLKDENKNTSPISENLKHEDATLENLINLKDSISSSNQPYVNLNAAVLNVCSSNESITYNCSLEPKSLPDIAEMPVTNDVQENTKAETDEQNKVLTVDQQSNTAVPNKSDSTCLETENQMTHGQENVSKRTISTAKKSRWDIVGQDSSECDNSQKTTNMENKPAIKKVISIKEVEFSKGRSQQDFKDNVQEAETHSTIVKQIELSKQDVEADRSSATRKYKDQSELSQASPNIDYCDLQLIVSEKTSINGPVHISNALQVDIAAKMQSWNKNDHEERAKESYSTSKLRTPPNQDAFGGQSEVSDSDNSEYDSDCDEAIKRLHSVVVVPKNSSLTMEMQDTGASCSSMANSEHHSANIAFDANIPKVMNEHGPEQRHKSSSAAFGTNSGPCAGLNESSKRSMLFQSQSNMIDSTSPSEGSSSISGLPVPGSISACRSTTDPAYSFESSKLLYSQHAASSRGEHIQFLYQQEGFSCAGNISDKSHFVWDFSQLEQPSSTYQQPDSSHGPQLLNTKPTETSVKGQEHGLDCASLNHQSPNMPTSRKPYLHSDENCQDLAGEIHPDSLTNDHDDYNSDKPTNHSQSFECSSLNTPGSSSFVQGHEISSNSRGSVVPDPPSVHHYRPQRGRGPPKKRHHEVESESDNEAEAGPTSKRERQGDTDTPKETLIKAQVHHPSLTLQDFQDAIKWKELSKSKKMPPYFDLIEENLYLTER